MDPITLGLIGGGVLGLINQNEQADAEKRRFPYQLALTRTSGITGKQGQLEPSAPGPWGSLLAGATSGAAFGGNIKEAQAKASLYQEIADKIDAENAAKEAATNHGQMRSGSEMLRRRFLDTTG